ncbi:hypothetical protein T09_8939 [Trichinella sp. T9]|nr:hypothetical protein T09_8939 [Trichinella sp. T9]
MKFSLFLLKGTYKNWCTEEGVTPSSGRIAMTNVGYVHQNRVVALVSSILTLMPQRSSESVSMQRAARDPRPVLEIYDELASNASTSLETAAHFPTWEQAWNTMYYSRSKRYPRLPARRQDLRLTTEQTTTKSSAQFFMYHSPTNDILIFATEDGVKLLAQSNCWCRDWTFKIVPSWKDLPTYSRIFEVLHSKAEELGVQLEPAKFVCDFETALIPAIQGNFPNTQVQGCFFHFCQAVLRQVGRLGLRNDYINLYLPNVQ